MYPVNQTYMATNNAANSQVFLIEAIFQNALKHANGFVRRRGKVCLKVTYERINAEIQRITRSGGKIISITPLSASNNNYLYKHVALPWWVEIITTYPQCLYYFGPFDSPEEARTFQSGYIEDLEAEGAEGIAVKIKQCQPQVLTQEDE